MNVIDYSWDFTVEEFSLDLDFFNEKDQEDKLWQARTGLNHETLCAAIETVIFMSERPVNLQKIKNLIDPDLPLRVVHESIARLQEEYESKHHGIRLMEVAQGYQFRTKATFSKLVQSMYKISSMQLSPTALEVLAIIAYKQPISKTSIESIRGVDSSHVVRQLMDKRLVRICGRSEELGRPSLYGTTQDFLEVFNLPDISSLPSESELDELASASDVASINEIKTIVQSSDKKRFDFDELEELDELGKSIRDISSDTIFTKSLLEMDKKRSDEEGVEKKSAFDLLEEYVSKTQVIEQNKASIESDLLSSFLDPKIVSPGDMDKLHNTPELIEDDEIETQADEETVSKALHFSELPKGESHFDEELADDGLAELERSLEENNENVMQAMRALVRESDDELEAKELSDALDIAFDQLMSKEAQQEDNQEDNLERDEDDIDSDLTV